MARHTKAKHKKAKSERTVRCSKCSGSGHNARSCDQAVATSAADETQAPSNNNPAADNTADSAEESHVSTADTPAEGPPEPDEVFDLGEDEVDGYAPAGDSDHDDGTSDPTPSTSTRGKAEPGLQVRIPKKKRARSKAELAFWKATEEKLAPGALTDAGRLSLDIPRISSGNFGIDVGLYGGIPQGRFVRITGLPKASKTGFCLNTVANYQANHCSECFGPKDKCKCDSDVPDVLWIDVEHRLSQMLRWVEGHGVNLECFRVMGPPTGQNVVDLVDHVIRSAPQSKTGLIIVDSLAQITSKEEISKATLDGPTVGRNAMLLNAAWRKWTSALHSLGIENQYKPTVLCINQIRHKVGVNYGSPETMPGGLGQDYASTVDIRFNAGPPNFVVWDEKKGKFVVKQKGYKSTFKPSPDQTPDFITVDWRVTASGHCPPGRSGQFNYWLKNAHGHRCGDPDNGLQLWDYCKRYDLIETDGVTKRLLGHEARTFDDLQAAFRSDPKAQRKAWSILMEKLAQDEDKV